MYRICARSGACQSFPLSSKGECLLLDPLSLTLSHSLTGCVSLGYGAYKGQANSNQILEDAERVFDFLTETLGFQSKDIFLFGRSIGSGPATHLASKRRPGALMLMCPYTSIRSIVKDLVGSFAQYLVAERFRNVDKISKVKCPSFFVHGQQDKLIPYQHSIELMSQCQGMTYLSLSEKMTHNDFNMVTAEARTAWEEEDLPHFPSK